MSLHEMASELSSDYQVQESKLINHPEYFYPVIITRHGWARKGKETVWHTTKIEQVIKEKNHESIPK